MKKILITLLFLIVIAAQSIASSNTVIGTWVLDETATEEYMRTSPQWDAQAEKFLPSIFRRMGKVKYVFDESSLSITQGEKSQTLDYAVTEDGNPLVLDMQLQGQDMTLTISFKSDDQIIMKSSATDDMDYYIWKRVK